MIPAKNVASRKIPEINKKVLDLPNKPIEGPASTNPIRIEPKKLIPKIEFATTSFSRGTRCGIRGDSAGT
jgi:hypothetical protein